MTVKEPILNYWYRALHSGVGVEIICSDVEYTKQRLYTVRRESKDEELKKISIVQSPFDPQKLWLVKRKSDG